MCRKTINGDIISFFFLPMRIVTQTGLFPIEKKKRIEGTVENWTETAIVNDSSFYLHAGVPEERNFLENVGSIIFSFTFFSVVWLQLKSSISVLPLAGRIVVVGRNRPDLHSRNSSCEVWREWCGGWTKNNVHFSSPIISVSCSLDLLTD